MSTGTENRGCCSGCLLEAMLILLMLLLSIMICKEATWLTPSIATLW